MCTNNGPSQDGRSSHFSIVITHAPCSQSPHANFHEVLHRCSSLYLSFRCARVLLVQGGALRPPVSHFSDMKVGDLDWYLSASVQIGQRFYMLAPKVSFDVNRKSQLAGAEVMTCDWFAGHGMHRTSVTEGSGCTHVNMHANSVTLPCCNGGHVKAQLALAVTEGRARASVGLCGVPKFIW